MTYFSLTIGISTLTLYVCIQNPASEFQLFYSSRITYYSSHTDVCEGFDIKKNAFIFMERIHVFKAVTSLYHLIKELQDVIDIVTWPNTFFDHTQNLLALIETDEREHIRELEINRERTVQNFVRPSLILVLLIIQKLIFGLSIRLLYLLY